jgi:DNA-binding response OmpR family regulator
MAAFAPPAAPPARTTTVLVVDDNPALRHSAEAMLALAGLGCVALADSISALCALVEHRPRAVLLDADSGPLQPWQFAQLVAQHPDHAATTLVYTSTRDDVIERSRAQAAGIDCFLAKPFSAEELWAIVGGTADKAA